MNSDCSNLHVVLLVSVCLYQVAFTATTRVKRQGWLWQNEIPETIPNQRPTGPPVVPTTLPQFIRPQSSTSASSTGPSSTTSTTASPQFRDCLTRCPITPEYNPVCGTDRITYDNTARLQCARRCGTSEYTYYLDYCLNTKAFLSVT